VVDWFRLSDLGSLALVQFGLKTPEFLAYSPLEFHKLLSIKKEVDYNHYKQDMERMRMQTFYLVNVHLGDKQVKTFEALMPFDWDTKAPKLKDKILTEEDWLKLDAKFSVGNNKIITDGTK
jgi:hypothetical protein